MRFEGRAIKGKLAEWLISDAVNSAAARLEELIVLSVSAWSATGFSRFDDSENARTVRLYYFATQVVASEPDFSLFQVIWEAPAPSPDILHGLALPNSSRRPDLQFAIGRTRISVEAKRLDGSARLYNEYVQSGMARFWLGFYDSNPGIMIAYLEKVDAHSARDGVNAAVIRVDRSGEDRRLLQPRDLTQILVRSTSVYSLSRELIHFCIAC